MSSWRYIAEDGVAASQGLAADEYLVQGYRKGLPPKSPALRLYTYKSHCILVGRFQNVWAEVNAAGAKAYQELNPRLTFCFGGRVSDHGIAPCLNIQGCYNGDIAINRRITGGGTILMGEGQLGVALATSSGYPGIPSHPQEFLETCAQGIREGLRELGIEAHFRLKNDIEVGGRKIAGLGVYQDDQDSLLFHASVLVDFDVRLMLALLNVPAEKLSDKAIASVAERLTTVNKEIGRRITTSEVREKVKQGFAHTFGINFLPQPFTEREQEEIKKLEKEKYLSEEWIYQRSPPADTMGSSTRKTKAGLITVYVALAGEVIKSVLITGDFFSSSATINNLEAKLKWNTANKAEVERIVGEVLSHDGNRILNLPPESLVEIVCEAIAEAQIKRGEEN